MSLLWEKFLLNIIRFKMWKNTKNDRNLHKECLKDTTSLINACLDSNWKIQEWQIWQWHVLGFYFTPPTAGNVILSKALWGMLHLAETLKPVLPRKRKAYPFDISTIPQKCFLKDGLLWELPGNHLKINQTRLKGNANHRKIPAA